MNQHLGLCGDGRDRRSEVDKKISKRDGKEWIQDADLVPYQARYFYEKLNNSKLLHTTDSLKLTYEHGVCLIIRASRIIVGFVMDRTSFLTVDYVLITEKWWYSYSTIRQASCLWTRQDLPSDIIATYFHLHVERTVTYLLVPVLFLTADRNSMKKDRQACFILSTLIEA